MEKRYIELLTNTMRKLFETKMFLIDETYGEIDEDEKKEAMDETLKELKVTKEELVSLQIDIDEIYNAVIEKD